ncbi:PIG-L family deacetylase [Polyangium sp. 15x6]|uniref:PIG-L deacetylase family protein n=1 Tax=Polyangium sp. 15x6 TaxID=3042687 RepID=UPI00249B4992|nr:PIG-L family deacetylase [Polyangium sp. 15x6]MDI3289049.1 PIG-L family deacetylase [Polyangium sp. 15x6]
MKLPASALFVGAHCDDIELLAGGLLARACRTGVRVGVLVFSDHRGVVSVEAAAQARAEMQANLRWLAARTGAEITDHTDVLLPACEGAFEAERGRIYAALEVLRDRYEVVVTHPIHDTNQDHQQVAREAARVFKAHATLLAGEFPNNDLGDGRLEVYVPLDERDVEAKVHMVTAYTSQRFGGRPYLDEGVVRALATLRGSQVRERAAEAFFVLGRLIAR